MDPVASLDRAQSTSPGSLALPGPYLLFLGDTVEPGFAKTAFGLRDWAPDRCIGELTLPGGKVSTGLPELDVKQAYARGARALLIGVASPGGAMSAHWLTIFKAALEAGLDIVAGLHSKLNAIPELRGLADRLGRRLIDVRTPPDGIAVATGRKRSGQRLLTVGTDCALGKKYTALAIARGLQARGFDATFRATGQTGIMIAGSGMPIDAVIADFIAGAAEMLSPSAHPGHIDVIEGQGSLFHPAYAAVSLGLLHGSQPDRVIVCHQPGRETILGVPGYPVPSIQDVIDQTLSLGRIVNPEIRCVGVSLNTSALSGEAAEAEIAATARALGLPVADPVRGGDHFDRLLDACA